MRRFALLPVMCLVYSFFLIFAGFGFSAVPLAQFLDLTYVPELLLDVPLSHSAPRVASLQQSLDADNLIVKYSLLLLFLQSSVLLHGCLVRTSSIDPVLLRYDMMLYSFRLRFLQRFHNFR
jgi:hypothetical protein